MQKGMRNNGTELGELRKKLEASQVCCCTETERERNILNTKGNGK
jgi:hypothetical protein